MRLIDADALSKKLIQTTIFIKDGEVFQRMINDAPTVGQRWAVIQNDKRRSNKKTAKAESGVS